MIIGGMKQKDVATRVEIPLGSVQRWRARDNRGETLLHVPGAERPSQIYKEAKVVIAKL